MLTIHLRSHGFGSKKPRIRVWTDEMFECGQFCVHPYDDVQNLKNILDKLSIALFQYHHCDGVEECNCPFLAYGENIPTE